MQKSSHSRPFVYLWVHMGRMLTGWHWHRWNPNTRMSKADSIWICQQNNLNHTVTAALFSLKWSIKLSAAITKQSKSNYTASLIRSFDQVFSPRWEELWQTTLMFFFFSFQQTHQWVLKQTKGTKWICLVLSVISKRHPESDLLADSVLSPRCEHKC